MNERRAQGCLVASLVWLVILGLLAVGYRYLVHPYLSEKLKRDTASDSRYRHQITVAADSFSGYAILRSPALRDDLKNRQIKLTVQDDKGDGAARLKALQSGAAQMAVFTIDSLLSAGARAGSFPASIVLVLDETKGGDAIVALDSAVKTIEDLNDPSARIVLTPGSPSEFLARVLIAHFNLPALPAQWMEPAQGAADVCRKFKAAQPADKRAFVLWEPYVSQALQRPGARVLLDTSKLKGCIVDVLVAERSFLREHPDLVQTVLESYSRALYAYSQKPGALVSLIVEDARSTGAESLDETRAGQVAAGIQWRNTLENYAHFGLGDSRGPSDLVHLEDIIGNIMDILLKTQALTKDPLDGRFNTLFYSAPLAAMKTAGFHPGKGLSLIEGAPPAGTSETVRADKELVALTPEQWNRLRPVGHLRTEPISFRRASAKLSEQGERDLQDLVRRLKAFPQFYLRVVGQARAEGDPDANRQLAQARAEAAAQFLTAQGLNPNRIKTDAAVSAESSGEAQAVSFLVGQAPY